MTDAHRATGVAYSTIFDLAKGRIESPRARTLAKLEEWSRKAGKTHGVYLSEVATRGLKRGTNAATPVQS